MRPIRALAIALLCAVAVLGQTNRGAISGTVFDATGAVIPGATVTVTNVGTNQTLKFTTSEAGFYSATSLEPVTYSVTVEAEGFKKGIVERVKVDTAATTTVNVTLEAGAIETEVTVIAAEAPLINAESGTTSQTITERQIQDIPLNNRSVLDLAVTTPNVTGDVGSEDPTVTSGATVPGFNLSLNGGRPGSTAILADGVNNTGVGLARAVVSFSPETVQEFTVQTSAYSAEFGQTGGGVINATTKSGTNTLSGTALWYHRNPAANAAQFTTSPTNRPPNNLRTNQVSFTVGGPVFLPKIYDGRNRTFFFVAIEPRWRRDFVVTDTLLPTEAMRRGDFSNIARVANGWAPADVVARFGIPVIGPSTIYRQFNVVGNQLQPLPAPAAGQTYPVFPGNVIPQEFLDLTALKALGFMPPAGDYFINDSGQLANFVVNRFVKQDEVRYTTRIDHTFSEKDRINFRFTIVPAVGQRGFGSDINGNSADNSYSRQALVSETHTFSPTLINDLRINYTRGRFSLDYTPEFSIKGGRNLATELGLPSLTEGGMPLFQFLDGPNAFANIGSAGSTNNFNVEERYNINDIVYWNRGAMTWKFGFDISHERLNVIPFFAAAGGRWDFRVVQTSSNRGTATGQGGNSFASYLMGVSNAALIRPVLIPYYYRWNNGAAFVQNDWKVRPNFTLNLGVRYSLQFPRKEKNDLQGVFLPDLAKEFPLAQPLRLADGRVITTALVPPFAYAGRGGRSRYITPVEYFNFEPRFGFAWSPKLFGWNQDNRLAIRGGYGLSHAPLTGNNRLPNPDFGATNTVSTTASGSTGTVDPRFPLRLSSNPPLLPTITVEQALKIPQDGLVYLESINVPGFAIADNPRIPYVQNWNLTVSYQPMRNTVIEAAYVGSKGTHLFMPLVNINPRPFDYIDLLDVNNLDPNATVVDPLGRRNLLGSPISVQIGTLASPFLGFNRLNRFYDTSANSIRHATYVSINRRVRNGLTFTANYTYGKSIDDASDASPDRFVLTTGSTQGHVTFGAPRRADRSISTFDIKHNFTSTFIWDIPIGQGRRFLTDAWAPVQWVAGGWTVSGLYRLQGGYPFLPKIVDANRLSADQTHTVRPIIVPGVSLRNPLWERGCPVGALCEPYINPAAFMRPLKGRLGDAPRTLEIRGPMQNYFDLSFQKNFPIREKLRVQFRVDLINAFNHPNFRLNPGDAGTDLLGAPTETLITAAEYDAWAASVPGRPARTTPAGAALFTEVQQLVTSNRLPSGALPLDFFTVPLPQGFATTAPNSFDITTLEGYKLYRLRQVYNPTFGSLFAVNNPRYIQFGLRIFF